MFGNGLLDALEEAHSYDFKGRLRPIDFFHGDVMASSRAAIDAVVFPSSGVISILVELETGQEIETGLIGRRGTLGGGAVWGATHHTHKAVRVSAFRPRLEHSRS